MREVLLIAFYFNQRNEIASKRLRGLAKYLPKYGWNPTIITPRIKKNQYNEKGNEDFLSANIIETQYTDMIDKFSNKKNKNKKQINENTKTSKIIHIAGELFAYPDGMKYWYKPAIKESSKIIENNNIEGIISSSWPITSHIIAKNLHEKFNIPWIADLRDIWNKNPYINHNFIRNYFEMKLEEDTFREANVLTTTTKLSKKVLQEIHPDKNVYVIPNGYENKEFQNLNKINKNHNKLSFTYAGKLYSGKRDPTILFKSLRELINEKLIDENRIIINFYGDNENLKQITEKYKIEKSVNINGYINHEEILKKEYNSDILLLISWLNPKEQIFIPGKVYEYMGLKRPILSIGYKNGCLKDLINETKIGYHVSTVPDCKKVIMHYYKEFDKNNSIKYNGNEKVKDYRIENTSLKFSKLLNSIS